MLTPFESIFPPKYPNSILLCGSYGSFYIKIECGKYPWQAESLNISEVCFESKSIGHAHICLHKHM